MMDLTVEIDGDIGTLEEALGQFTAPEILDKDNKYNCSRFVIISIFTFIPILFWPIIMFLCLLFFSFLFP